MWTADNFHFQMPLLGFILCGYFIEGRPKWDLLLIARLHHEQCIPVALIIMAMVLVQFISKVENLCNLSVFRLDMLYKSMHQGIRWSMHLQQPTLSASEFSKIDFFIFLFSCHDQLLICHGNYEQSSAAGSSLCWASTDWLVSSNDVGLFLWIYRSILLHSLPSF